VANLPLSYETPELEALFIQYGQIIKSNILKGRGIGFVHFSTHDEAEQARVALDKFTLSGHSLPLVVQYAQHK